MKTVTRAGSAGLFLMAAGPYLSWLSLTFLERLSGHPLKPLPVSIGTYRHRTGMVSRRSSDDMSPFGLFRGNRAGNRVVARRLSSGLAMTRLRRSA